MEDTITNTETDDNVIETENPIDVLENKVNALVDELSQEADNGSNGAAENAEDAHNTNARLDELEKANARLTEMVGKMITVYGARMNENDSQGVEAFPSTVEKTFEAPVSDIPSLGDIVLGS